jgi:Cytochrome bd terminal oxidase subunit I
MRARAGRGARTGGDRSAPRPQRGRVMTDAAVAVRLQFAFTIMFHYLFPILTIGLAPLLVLVNTLHLIRGDEVYAAAARF